MSEKATIRETPGVTGWGTVNTTRPEHKLVVIKLGVTARVTRRPAPGPPALSPAPPETP